MSYTSVNEIRTPAMKKARIYLDHQSTTPIDPRAYAAMEPWFREEYGNPHATVHAFGWRAHGAIEESRARIASLVRSDPEEIIFTSGATEANNMAIIGVARALKSARDEILISAIEHASVTAPCAALKEDGFRITVIPVDHEGHIDLGALEARLSHRVALVSVMAVNNEIGTIQSLAEIIDKCRRVGALVHSDAAQALCAMDLDTHGLGIDLMTLSSHKCYGPKGVGALYLRAGLPVHIRPLMFGGGQESGLRPGTLPTPLCVGFGRACEILLSEGRDERMRLGELSRRFLHRLLMSLPDTRVNGPDHARHPGNINVQFPGIDASILATNLQPEVACSIASSCHSGIIGPSHVLAAIGLNDDEINCSVRFGIGRFTTMAEVDKAAALIVRAAERLARELV